MEHEEIYTLMMDALDGEISSEGRSQMAAHLHTCPSCAREWQAVQAIHQLFQHSPMLSPAIDFTQRTLAALPNRRYRIWFLGGVYSLLLVSGIVPLAALIWLGSLLSPALNQPALVRSVQQSGSQLLQLAQVVVSAIWQGVGGVGDLLGQQPAILGWLFVMLGAVFLWGGIYNQLTSASTRA